MSEEEFINKFYSYNDEEQFLKDIYHNLNCLQKENKRLKERIAYIERSNNRREDNILEQRQEISDLEDNWNKLKEYLHNVDVVIDYSENYDGRFINYEELVNKMQKIEQGVE